MRSRRSRPTGAVIRPVRERGTEAVAEALTRTDPSRYTTAFSKAGREDKILIDYLRNNRTNTSVAATGIPLS